MTTAEAVIKRAESQLGVLETGQDCTPYGAWYGFPCAAWCAMFVSWCFYHEGLPLTASNNKLGYAWVPAGAEWFRRNGRWGTEPRLGANVFYDWEGDGVLDHVGIVTGFGSGVIETIEGNTTPGGRPDGVYRMRRRANIVGYGYPAFEEREEDDEVGLICDSWPAGQKQRQVLALPKVGRAITVKKAWFGFATGWDDATVHHVYFIADKGPGSQPGEYPVDMHEFALVKDDCPWWELPQGCTQISVEYTSQNPLGWYLETTRA